MFRSISGGMVDSGSGGRMVDSCSSGMEVVNSVSYGRIGVSRVSCQAKNYILVWPSSPPEWKFLGSMIDSQRR